MYIINRHIEYWLISHFSKSMYSNTPLTFVMPRGGFWCHTLDYSQNFQRSDKVFSSAFRGLYGAYLHTFCDLFCTAVNIRCQFCHRHQRVDSTHSEFSLIVNLSLIVISVLLNPNFSTAQHPIGTVYGKPSAVTEPQAIGVHSNGVLLHF